VSTEVRSNIAPDIVLEEQKIGYVWKHGVLRRAQVVVSTRSASDAAADQDEAASDVAGTDATVITDPDDAS
jgi:hypothetical protein